MRFWEFVSRKITSTEVFEMAFDRKDVVSKITGLSNYVL